MVQKDEGTPAPAKVQPRTPGLSILLVEDNEDARESLALLLTLNGHEVNAVTTGRAGVESVSAHPPDVLICDVGLPDLSGFQVIRAIRAAHPSAGLFAIALTGHAQPQDRDQAFQSGFDAHLAKPPDFVELDQNPLRGRPEKGRPVRHLSGSRSRRRRQGSNRAYQSAHARSRCTAWAGSWKPCGSRGKARSSTSQPTSRRAR